MIDDRWFPQPAARLPREHGSPDFLARKRDRLQEDHIAPINELTRRIAARTGLEVPMVDPDSAGVNARVLLVLESPGRIGVTSPKGSGMISCDNNDQTAANVWMLHTDTALRREWCMPWNIVPWYLGSTERNVPASSQDAEGGLPYFWELLDQLPHLRAVIAMGKPASAALSTLRSQLAERGVRLLQAPHPSPQNLNTRPGERAAIAEVFREARAIVEADLYDAQAHSEQFKEIHHSQTLVLDVNVLGRPASFATAHESAWRDAVSTACEAKARSSYDPTVSRFAVSIDFRTGTPKSANEWWDLDNLIKPTLDAMAIVFGAREWRGVPQAADDRVDHITASKRAIRSGEEPGAHIRVWTVTDQGDGTRHD
jgi:Holliday junction resolvase RusA-like endonuclease